MLFFKEYRRLPFFLPEDISTESSLEQLWKPGNPNYNQILKLVSSESDTLLKIIFI